MLRMPEICPEDSERGVVIVRIVIVAGSGAA